VAISEKIQAALRSRYLIVAAVLIGLLVILGVLYWLGWLGVVLRSPWFWAVLVVLVAIGVFVAVRWGLPWLQERRFVRQEASDYVVAGEESPEEFRAKFAKSLQMLNRLPQLKGAGNPVYALPWYLLIGAAQSGKTAVVQGAGLFSPLLPIAGDSGGTQNYDWWVSNSALVIDTAGRYAIPVEAQRDRAEWYRLLRLLHHHREQEPVNGLLLTVSAEWLASQPPETLRAEASKLRDRLEEAVRELGIDVPVYLLVTRCDAVEGFAEFFGQLPERMQNEALGYVNDAASSSEGQEAERGAGALHRLAAGLQSIYDRLHVFRLALLASQAPEGVRQAVFCFPEEFRALHQPLLAFAEPLLSADVRYHTPLFRAIYFTSTQQAATRVSLLRGQLNLGDDTTSVTATGKRYFLHDLFDSLLPRDRGLVSPTSRAQTRRGLRRLLGIGAMVAAVAVLAIVVGRAFAIDRGIVRSVDPAACADTAVKATGPALRSLDRCRQAVETVSEGNRQRPGWSAWLFNRSGRLEDHLRDRYLTNVKAALLEPLNNQLDAAFDGSTDPLPLMLLVAQRVQLSHRCAAASSGACSERSTEEVHPDYALMLNPARDRRAPPAEVAMLKQAYVAYLLWQPGSKDLLQQDLASDQRRLHQWLSAKQFTLDSLLPLVNRSAPPITSEDYWELPAPIATVGARIDAACTKKVWEQDVAPFLQQLQDAVPDAASRLRAFQAQYRTTCLIQWQRFLADFPQGTERWKGPERRRALALRLLGPESPVLRVLDDAAANLTPWVSAADPASAPPWAVRVQGFAASAQRKAYQEALAKINARLEHGEAPEVYFKLASEAFAEGKPSAESTAPVLRAWWVASQVQSDGAAAQKADEGVLKRLLEEPVRFVWRVILEEAAGFVQQRWADEVVAPLKGLPPAEQAVQLYGPGGKVGTFGEQLLRPFFTAEDAHVATVLGESVPFSPQFLQTLANARDLKPVLEGGTAAEPVTVTASQPSVIDSRGSVLGEETVLSVTCGGKAYRVTNKPQKPGESSTTVPWSSQGCGDVAVSVYFFAGEPGGAQGMLPGAKRLQLTKTYGGRTGFLQFLQDFGGGSHRFRIDDFPGADPDVLRSGVTAVTVSYQVEVPPALATLLGTLQGGAAPDNIVIASPS
jgi:type VI secretion system protein ImpL